MSEFVAWSCDCDGLTRIILWHTNPEAYNLTGEDHFYQVKEEDIARAVLTGLYLDWRD
jgi:hypothetical protein